MKSVNSWIKIGLNALTKLQSENLRKLWTAISNRSVRLQLIICHKKDLLRFFLYKTRADAQEVLPVLTGLYRYDEWMVQETNDENLHRS